MDSLRRDGYAALYHAVHENRYSCTKLLIEAGADVKGASLYYNRQCRSYLSLRRTHQATHRSRSRCEQRNRLRLSLSHVGYQLWGSNRIRSILIDVDQDYFFLHKSSYLIEY